MRVISLALICGLWLTAGMPSASAAQAGELLLVHDGRPNALLIVEAEAPKSLRAATALQTYIQKISGATLPLVLEGDPLPADAPPVRVHVGHTAIAAGQGVPAGYDPSVRPDVFEEEGYVLRTIDDRTLLVAGNNDGPYRGTIFAAYALLEQLGCRFYFPGVFGEVIPTRSTVRAPKLNILSTPDFPIRHVSFSGWVPVSARDREIYEQWTHQIGFSERRMYPVAGDGSLAQLVPPNEYFERHPEFFAQRRDGTRHRGRTASHTMLCLSNPDLLAESIRNLTLAFAGEKRMGSVTSIGVGISPPDGMPYCYCSNCLSQSQNFQYPQYGKINQAAQSEEFFDFARKIAEAFPDKWVSTMAYSLREWPPQGVKFTPNMAVTYAPISSDVLHPGDAPLWRRAQMLSILRQYRQQTPHVLIYDYNPGLLTGLFVPERDAANMAANARIYKEIGIKGMGREGRKAFMQTWLSYYAMAKLLWDVEADLEAIKAEFYELFFGSEAGPHVRAWWDACEAVLISQPFQAHEDFLITHLYTSEFTGSIQKHVEAALASSATEQQRTRLAAFALIAENLRQYAAMHDAERRMDWPAAAAAADRMDRIKTELHAIDSFLISPDNRVRRFFANGRKQRFEHLAAMTDGTHGQFVAELPLTMRFQRDPVNEGVIGQWYDPGHDDSGWDAADTYFLLEQQQPPLDARGYYYSGHVWYRTQVDVPADFAGREIHLHFNGIINEGWVWVNGQYVGHKPHRLWWGSPHHADFPVTAMLRPGERNTIAVRVMNHPDEVGGLYRRAFLHAPTSLRAQQDEAEGD